MRTIRWWHFQGTFRALSEHFGGMQLICCAVVIALLLVCNTWTDLLFDYFSAIDNMSWFKASAIYLA